MSQYGIGISSAGFKNDVTSPVNWSACSSNEEHSHSAVLLTPGDLGAHVNRSDEMLESYLRNFSQTRGIHGGSEQIEELLKNALSSQSHPIVSGSGIESNFGDNSIERFENNEQNEPNTKCSEQLHQFMSTSGVLVLPKLAANLLHYDSDERKQSPTSCLSRKTSPPSTTQSPTSSTELAIGIAAPKPIKTVHQLEFNGNESFSRNLQFSTADSSINIEQSPFFTNSMTTQSLDSGNMLPSTILRNILIASEAQNMTDVDSEVMRDIDNNSDSQMATALEGVTLDRMTSAEGRSDQNDNAVASGEYLNGNQKGSRSFFRAPGLEAPCSDGSAANFNAFECKICGFQSTSKFHYNSHMNTHTFHQCRMCNYTARTEGRLKKHMKASHTLEQRQAVGIEENLLAGPTSGSKSKLNGISDMETNNSKSRNNSTTEVDSNLLKLGINMVPVTISEATTTPLSLPPLDQLRALTERNETGSSVNSDELCESTSMGINRCAEELLENISALTPPTYTQQEQPQTRRSGRPKTYTCKQCGLISKSKEEQWEHARTHIPKEKQLTCNKCRFVTEYKHHLEYHIRNHYNSRPFQCTKCKYTCVNKSMLNSHMKSHTPAYPYRCQDCTYRTKYCHSLKMHLSKYNHRRMPGLEGFEEGIVSPGNIKDEQMDDESLADDTLIAGQQNNGYSTEQQLLNQVNQALIKQPTQIPTSMEYASQVLLNQQQPNKIETSNEMPYLCPFPEGCNYATNSNEELIKHFLGIHFMANQQQTNLQEFQISHQIQQRLAMQQLLQQQFNNPLLNQQLNLNFSATGLPRSYQETNIDPSLLIGLKSHEQKFMGEPELTQILNQIKQFQNCRATGEHNLVHFPERTELNHISPTESKESAECGTSSESPNSEPRRKERKDRKKTSTDSVDVNVEYHPDAVIPEKLQFSCQHCMMGFNDKALYLIHRGYHGFGSPFKCNRCGHVSKNSLEFNMHLYQGKHDD